MAKDDLFSESTHIKLKHAHDTKLLLLAHN